VHSASSRHSAPWLSERATAPAHCTGAPPASHTLYNTLGNRHAHPTPCGQHFQGPHGCCCLLTCGHPRLVVPLLSATWAPRPHHLHCSRLATPRDCDASRLLFHIPKCAPPRYRSAALWGLHVWMYVAENASMLTSRRPELAHHPRPHSCPSASRRWPTSRVAACNKHRGDAPMSVRGRHPGCAATRRGHVTKHQHVGCAAAARQGGQLHRP
jgi:hypothetical protein